MTNSDVVRVPGDRGPEDRKPDELSLNGDPAQTERSDATSPESADAIAKPKVAQEPCTESASTRQEDPLDPELAGMSRAERSRTDEELWGSKEDRSGGELSTEQLSEEGALASAAEEHRKALDEPHDPAALAVLWDSMQAAIQRRIQPEQFETWFRRTALASVNSESVVVAVLSSFSRTWLENYYRAIIEQSIEAVLGSARRLSFHIDPEYLASVGVPETSSVVLPPNSAPTEIKEGQFEETPKPERHDRSMPQPGAAITADGRTPGGLLRNSDVVLNPKYTFDNFVVGPCNRFGQAAAMGAAEQPGKAYNPFFLHGNVGVGKTHLLQGLCYLILEREPDSRILYLSCETFVNHFISALTNGDLTKFRNKYRNVDVLVVDDIHLLANKDRTQEEFFHTFNTLYNAGKQIVLSSDSPPKDIPTLQDRLVSRFKWGMVTEIEPPCFETRMAIVKRKSRDQGQEFPDDVVALIAENVENNVRELEGAVTRLAGYVGITRNPLTIATAREALSDLFKVSRGEPTMDDIITVVTEQYGVKQVDLQGKRRTQAIAYPRQIAMFLARHITRHSLEEIGAYFGGRDHSTVLYGVDKIKKKAASDAACRTELETLLSRLGGKGLDD